MQNVSVGDKSAVQGGGFSPPTPHLEKSWIPQIGSISFNFPEGSVWKFFKKKSLEQTFGRIKDWAKVLCLLSEVSNQIFSDLVRSHRMGKKVCIVLC